MATRTTTASTSKSKTRTTGMPTTVSASDLQKLVASRSKRGYTDARSERTFWKNAIKALTTPQN